jgi:hypothetical protein
MGWSGYGTSNKGEAVRLTLAGHDVVAKAWVGSTVYAAIRSPKGYVFGAVILVRKHKDEVMVKAMDESEGPAYYACPASVFKALTPVEEMERITGSPSPWAREWRQKVAEGIAAKEAARAIRPGTIIRFAAPMRFGDGRERQVLQLEARTVFRDEAGRRVRVPGWQRRQYEVVPGWEG